ncbi:hypothetical protein RAS14_05860 [Achromobacter aegrifaciens]|uniref:hypothetical protein n=1 Tax=Achromobacter aegrifaciens TaxID=1287736 RepID=UPI00278F687A|nr:hypothetical protein [Achromobacter aegrifaciens]MDQ1759264.1 hypothetical protein [Achromobacter aegrifaciens]
MIQSQTETSKPADASTRGAGDDQEAGKELARLRAELARVSDELVVVAAQQQELRDSMAFRVGTAISKSPIGALYRALKRSSHSGGAPDQEAAPSVPVVESTPAAHEPVPVNEPAPSSLQKKTHTEFGVAEIAALPEHVPISIAHPHWLGIRSSASQLFDHLLLVTDLLTPEDAREFVVLLLSRKPRAVVLQGFPFAYQHIVEAMHRLAPEVPVCVVWHGTFMQASEDYAWRSFRRVCALAREGKIRRIGCVKQGQEQVLRRQGLDAAFLLNSYRAIPERAAPVGSGPSALGIWSISELRHKPPYEMLAAASMVPNCKVVGSVASPRMLEFCEEFGIANDFVGRMIPQVEMPRYLKTAHLNLYVTLNECAPMLPLESFAVGVPCIVGPNTPYFANNGYLQDRLVVKVPDDAYAIAQCIERALSERDEIVAAYREYIVGHNSESARTVQQFLDF